MLKAIGGSAGVFYVVPLKTQNVLQDESLYEPCFLKHKLCVLLVSIKVSCHKNDPMNSYTLQEMCCGFLLSREMWYRKSVLPGTGAG